MRSGQVWYLVMNSSRARILRGLPAPHATAGAELTMHSSHRRLRDHLGERPATGVAAGSPSQQAATAPQADLLREDSIRFLRDVSGFLADQRHSRALDALVVVAPPEVLALWHHLASPALRPIIRREVARNLVRLTAQDLVAALRDLPADGEGPG